MDNNKDYRNWWSLFFLAIITRNNYAMRKYKKYMDIFYIYIISYFVLLFKKK